MGAWLGYCAVFSAGATLGVVIGAALALGKISDFEHRVDALERLTHRQLSQIEKLSESLRTIAGFATTNTLTANLSAEAARIAREALGQGDSVAI